MWKKKQILKHAFVFSLCYYFYFILIVFSFSFLLGQVFRKKIDIWQSFVLLNGLSSCCTRPNTNILTVQLFVYICFYAELNCVGDYLLNIWQFVENWGYVQYFSFPLNLLDILKPNQNKYCKASDYLFCYFDLFVCLRQEWRRFNVKISNFSQWITK